MRRDPGNQREAPNRFRAAPHQRLAPWPCVVVLGCAAAAALLAWCSNAGPASPSTGAALEASATEKSDAALAEAIRSGMQRASIPGAIVGVWREGQPPYVRAFGVRDTASGEPMTTDLSMRIGSNGQIAPNAIEGLTTAPYKGGYTFFEHVIPDECVQRGGDNRSSAHNEHLIGASVRRQPIKCSM